MKDFYWCEYVWRGELASDAKQTNLWLAARSLYYGVLTAEVTQHGMTYHIDMKG